MKKLALILAAVLLVVALPFSLAESTFTAKYFDGKLTWSGTGVDCTVDVYVDGVNIHSLNPNKTSGQKSIVWANGSTHTVKFDPSKGTGTTVTINVSPADNPSQATPSPTDTPTPAPTATPTPVPTATQEPTAEPTAVPTAEPTATPTPVPTATPIPTANLTKTSNGTITIDAGTQLQLVPSIATTSGWTVKSYTSKKTAVATVSGSGLVTAKAEGSSKITIKTSKKSITVTIKVVDPTLPTSIRFATATQNVNVGTTLDLKSIMTLAPNTALASKITWSTSKAKVATVKDGVVTPVAEGSAKITAKSGKVKATITIKVVDPNKPAAVTLDKTGTMTLKVGDTLNLTATLSPVTATRQLTWKTSSAKVATVTVDANQNAVVRAVKKGSATITVTTHNSKKATLKIKVVN
ncbi:MAG: Ig-like domain-containing protein [Clostridia bacterium]|nr:Ig-like domain-containing protein [Clostridia bacterium]